MKPEEENALLAVDKGVFLQDMEEDVLLQGSRLCIAVLLHTGVCAVTGDVLDKDLISAQGVGVVIGGIEAMRADGRWLQD